MNYQKLLNDHHEFYNKGQTRDYHFRIKMLIKLRDEIIKNEEKITKALFHDLGKSKEESYLTEIGLVLSEISFAVKHLKKWMKPKRVKTPLMLFPAKSYLYYEPYGTILVLSPWNYPFLLSLNPLIGAIASGNTCVLKPSGTSINTANIIKEITDNIFNYDYCKTIIGTHDDANQLLSLHFDYIFFTGSPKIGKHVMSKASENLIPVTLELGGKSPAIISDFKNIDLAAKRIAYGKLINSGQTCIAPDYVLINENEKALFIESFSKYVKEFYGDNPLNCNYYPKIINNHHHQRLSNLIKDENVAYGGKANDTKIEPTLLTDISFDSKIMQEEIFGPILPIITYNNLDAILDRLTKMDKPLAFYLFTDNKKEAKRIINNHSFGGLTLNDTIMHFANQNLPFGGIGNSGMGSYHGYQSFLTFSHQKSVLKRGKIDLSIRYHPITDKKNKIIRKFSK